MPWNTATPVLIWAVVCIPLTVLMWFKRPKDKLTNILILLDYFLANLFCFLCINWVIVNYWLHFWPLVFTIVLIIRFISKSKRTLFLPSRSRLALTVVALLILPVVSFLDVRALSSLSHVNQPGQTAYLAFPLRLGLYATLNGGNGMDGIGMNSYYQDWLGRKTSTGQGMAYALDAVKISLEGSLTPNGAILPRDYNKYIGFLDKVYSPCIGTVDYIEDNHPEIKPFTSSPSAGLGNLVVIRCVDIYVTLSNLRSGSIVVKVGDTVNLRSMIAMVGSTADNTFPHLHIQANNGSRDGPAMPMLFEGFEKINRFIVRNDLTNR
jgi:hypothetical protein